MTSGIDILAAAERHVLAALSEAIGSGARKFETTLRAKTPVNRRKTRRYTTSVHRRGELKAVAGVIFPSGSRFNTDGTKTEQIVERVYQSDGQKILDHIEKQMSAAVGQQASRKIEIRKG